MGLGLEAEYIVLGLVFYGASITKVGAPLGIRLGLLPLRLRAPRCLGSGSLSERLKY